MKTIKTFDELRNALVHLEKPVGLIPTMGYLHQGHLSLVRKAKEECSSVIVTIFVNPTQFGPGEDFSNYPRDIQADLKLLEMEAVDLVWIPSSEEMYPTGYQTWVNLEELSQYLEGTFRPGHFQGVTTIVAKLLIATSPQKAYFGQKDAQQSIIIKRMVQELNFNLEIVICPTVREDDGLAMSSRNSYLNPEQREAASVLYRALETARSAFNRGVVDAEQLRELMSSVISYEPLAHPQYIACSHLDTLEEWHGNIVGKALLSMAVYFGTTRLIDNMILGEI